MSSELILPFFRSLGLDGYLVDPDISELMITNGRVFVEYAGKVTEIPDLPIEERTLRAGIEVIGRRIGDEIDDYQKPYLDARLPDGSRVAAIYPPMSPHGVTLTIRKFLRHFTTEELLERRALDPESFGIILDAVERRKNILFCGGTSTGKTTMTNAFVRHIPLEERLIVIEKPVEIQLEHRNVLRLEAYPPVGDRPGATISQLLSMALRHRPDRIIVGEVKDSEAAYGLLQAMNTGHDGTLSTIHANDASLALNRLASLAMPGFGSLALARQETTVAIDLVVAVRRDREGWRGVDSILQVLDYDADAREFETEELYRRSARKVAA